MELREIFIKQPEMKELLLRSAIGLEKENMRVWGGGHIALTPHPFGNKATHPFITTDFSESQVEIGTEVCANPHQVYDQLENLHDIVSTTVAVENDAPEYLWPISNPPMIRDEAEIPVAKFVGEAHSKETYREYLADKYGKKIMLYCGIHYNFSFDRDLIRRLHQILGRCDDPQCLQSELYLTLAKNCYLYSWFPVVMTAAVLFSTKAFWRREKRLAAADFMGYSSMSNSQVWLLE